MAHGETRAGWRKHGGNPVLGGPLGTCFDIAVLKEGGTYRMWFSWRPKKSVALVESGDGILWSEPRIALGPVEGSGWQGDINRASVVRHGGAYRMWYTGQAKGRSWIGHAESDDGVSWRRDTDPVVSPERPWEGVAIMCPHVTWDEDARQFRMWYSGGEQYEPDSIGYATSPDGKAWSKWPANPVFTKSAARPWERCKVAGGQVLRHGGWHVMFYIGFEDIHTARIGIARSRDGIADWERHPLNPIISPSEGSWDHHACYKPFAVFDGVRWMLWYNGRRDNVEQIGLAFHDGEDLGFE